MDWCFNKKKHLRFPLRQTRLPNLVQTHSWMIIRIIMMMMMTMMMTMMVMMMMMMMTTMMMKINGKIRDKERFAGACQ